MPKVISGTTARLVDAQSGIKEGQFRIVVRETVAKLETTVSVDNAHDLWFINR